MTLCGDWAGTSYEAAGCPGTCAERVADPTSFVVSGLLLRTTCHRRVANSALLEPRTDS